MKKEERELREYFIWWFAQAGDDPDPDRVRYNSLITTLVESMGNTGCQCICHKYPEHFPFDALAEIPAVIRGHKSHWQETFSKVQRDDLLEDVAKHVEAALAAPKEG